MRPSPGPDVDGARLQPGRPWPLGAQVRDGGVNFAVHAPHARALELCLFDETGSQERQRLALHARSGATWHGFLPGAQAGLVYGLRAHGPWDPASGHRFAPHKVLLDPWAREIVGEFQWQPEHQGDDPRDNAATALKARVVDEPTDGIGPWHHPRHASEDLLVYEVHVKGFTQRHPRLPPALQGTYAGLASDEALAHLRSLGVTVVSLLPVHQHLDERHLQPLGLRNYWGYNTIGYFCPEPLYAAAWRAASGHDAAAAAGVRAEFREMVRRLHAAGIEVWLDVVYNHTAESDEHGPTLSWRGLDNRAWYRLPHANPAGYDNYTGCGNTLDIRQAGPLRLVLDSLRHWVQAYGVDGFRFDLAAVLGRGDHGFERHAPFFQALAQDPVLAGTRLVAEPWDVGPGGYRLGQFPSGWMEWNDRFRDTMRAFWLGHRCDRAEVARRLSGSADHFRHDGRSPAASVNYVTAHDGFTLRDLVSYEHRHNEANGEGNRDGHGHNLSTHCGHEGPSDDPAVLARRDALQRALLACVMLAQGTPMICAGSELGHTQGGNNNAYCQDNEVGWLDWAAADGGLVAFLARLARLRREHLPLDGRWYDGVPAGGAAGPPHTLHDLAWRQADGSALDEQAWHDLSRHDLAVLIGEPGRSEEPMLLLLNASRDSLAFALPPGCWQVLLDTRAVDGAPARAEPRQGALLVGAGSLLVLERLPG